MATGRPFLTGRAASRPGAAGRTRIRAIQCAARPPLGTLPEDGPMRMLAAALLLALAATTASSLAQVRDFVSVAQETLRNPSPDDWLMFSRT